MRTLPRPVPEVDRATNADLAFLAMDGGPVPEQFAAVLLLDSGHEDDLVRVERALAHRVTGVPKLGRRLARTPPGCGRPIWIDDGDFDVRRHLRRVTCLAPGDEPALLATVLPLVLEPLPRDRPLWRAVLVDGLAGGRGALVLVLHHVLADGLSGVAVLARLADRPGGPPPRRSSRAVPSAARLAADAMRGRWHAIRGARKTWRQLRASTAAGGGLHPARAEPCSLLARTGPRRRAAAAHADFGPLRAAAHRHGGTVNAAVVSAVAGAVHQLLATRGETLETLLIAVPVAGRGTASAEELGNQVAPLLVSVPAAAAAARRIPAVAEAVRRDRRLATAPPPIALAGAAFRLLASLGGYRWYMNHQRRLHTLVSYVRGPEHPVSVAGVGVGAVIPLTVGGAGNIAVAFQAVSYAGRLTVTAMADPGLVPDLPVLARALQAELDELTGNAGGSPVRS